MLHNLRCSLLVASTHEDGSLLHTPGHVGPSNPQEGVHSEGPGAGGGAELLAAGVRMVAAAREEAVLGVTVPPLHQAGRQLARGGGGGEEHLRGLSHLPTVHPHLVATGYEYSCKYTNLQTEGQRQNHLLYIVLKMTFLFVSTTHCHMQ